LDQLSPLEGLQWARLSWRAPCGYAITILYSKKNKHQAIYKVWLKCDRGRKYQPRGLTNDSRIRLTASRCIQCPFSAIGKLNDLGDWVLVSLDLTVSKFYTNSDSLLRTQSIAMSLHLIALRIQVYDSLVLKLELKLASSQMLEYFHNKSYLLYVKKTQISKLLQMISTILEHYLNVML
jgi:hypothetical protein